MRDDDWDARRNRIVAVATVTGLISTVVIARRDLGEFLLHPGGAISIAEGAAAFLGMVALLSIAWGMFVGMLAEPILARIISMFARWHASPKVIFPEMLDGIVFSARFIGAIVCLALPISGIILLPVLDWIKLLAVLPALIAGMWLGFTFIDLTERRRSAPDNESPPE